MTAASLDHTDLTDYEVNGRVHMHPESTADFHFNVVFLVGNLDLNHPQDYLIRPTAMERLF